jgi:hypothetical protein
MGEVESCAWLEDMFIAVGQGPALSQPPVTVTERMNCGALPIKDEVIFGIKLDCRWKFLFKTI